MTDESIKFTLPSVDPNNKIRLTPEEIAVLKECNVEGFSKRGVPCGLALGVAAFYALKAGYLKPNSRFGMIPSIAIAGTVGCLTGTLSYKRECLDRVLAVPNGTLRQRFEDAIHKEFPQQPTQSTELPRQSYELNEQRPMISGSQMDVYQSNNNFDGFTGVNTDSDEYTNVNPMKPLPKYNGITTYDDLRQRNRDEYMRNTSRQNIPPPRGPPQGSSDYPPLSKPSSPIFEDTRPFDRDRVPQYQLD